MSSIDQGFADELSNEELSRRKFLVMMGWGGILASVAGSALGAFSYIVPRVLYEPSTVFKIGTIADYPEGVTESWKEGGGFWVVKNNRGIYAMITICRHLGCTPNWFSDQQLFRCPCHGSIYDTMGNVLGGPAPRTLWRAKIMVDPIDGQLIVDTALRQDPDPKSTDKGLVVEELSREIEPFFVPA